MSRRSQRIKNQKYGITISSVAPEASSMLHRGEPPEVAARSERRPAAKARRVDATPSENDDYVAQSTSKVKKKVACALKKRGKLCQMLDMPIDVMMEVSPPSPPMRELCTDTMYDSYLFRYALT